MASWARQSLISSLDRQGRSNNMISISEVGRERPTALDPKSEASAYGKMDLVKYLTLSKAITLL